MTGLNIAGGKKFTARALAGFGILAASVSAHALVIDINSYVTGSGVTSNTTVAALTLMQNGSDVDFSFNNLVNNLSGGAGDDAFISQLLFSFDRTPALTAASFSNFGGTQPINASAFAINSTGKDAGYDFYLALSYPTSAANRFTHGEFSTWTISNVVIDDFLQPVTGSGPASLAMAHIQQVGVGPGGADSVKYAGNISSDPPQLAENPIPEPGSLALLLAGLAGLAAIYRRPRVTIGRYLPASPCVRESRGTHRLR
jgi:PEP-CTERM motif